MAEAAVPRPRVRYTVGVYDTQLSRLDVVSSRNRQERYSEQHKYGKELALSENERLSKNQPLAWAG